MKTLFTICLVPVAFVGLGILASAGWQLFKLGWHMGKEAVAMLKQRRSKATIQSFCKCWFCLNTGPNGECEKCGLPPSPERLQHD